MVSLRPITGSNRQEIEAMRTAPEQERFVSTVVDSFAEPLRQTP